MGGRNGERSWGSRREVLLKRVLEARIRKEVMSAGKGGFWLVRLLGGEKQEMRCPSIGGKDRGPFASSKHAFIKKDLITSPWRHGRTCLICRR